MYVSRLIMHSFYGVNYVKKKKQQQKTNIGSYMLFELWFILHMRNVGGCAILGDSVVLIHYLPSVLCGNVKLPILLI